MGYKTYNEQLAEHLTYLQSQGFDITELIVDSGWIRCHSIGVSQGRGEFAYISNTEKLNNGLLGIKTSFRSFNGFEKYSTYGQWPNGNEQPCSMQNHLFHTEIKDNSKLHELAARKAYGFWNHSSNQGKSDYLDRKGIGHYGIRFRSSEQYGNVAVVPMFDMDDRLWSYQLLNPDGTKRFPKDCRTEGLFHKLKDPIKGKPIGIAESYVTAATCFELSGISIVCAFNASNLPAVTSSIHKMFPYSPLIIFADNDRHLESKGGNLGVLKAQEAQKINQGMISLVIPCFDDFKPSKEASDWNDLVRLKGKNVAKSQIDFILSR